MSKTDKPSLREHLFAKYHEIEEEMVAIYRHQEMWRQIITFSLQERQDYAIKRSRELAEATVERLDKLRELDKQIENLTPEQEQYDDMFYSILDVANCIKNNLPMDRHSLNGFMILLTANIGELQGRIESLPDSIEWKKNALDKLNNLLVGNYHGDETNQHT